MNPATAAIPFRWLPTGDEAFAAMLAAIAATRESLRLEMYIFAPGPTGERFRDALVAAAQRGVRTTVLVDAFGSSRLPGNFWQPLLQAGGQCRWFNPLSFKRFTFRDHRKVLVCDESTAFVGGFNIAPEYEGDGVSRGWRDVGLMVRGDLARGLTQAFDAQFARADAEHLVFTRLRRAPARQFVGCAEGDLLLSGPGRGVNAIKRALVADLRTAREVRIVAAYFVPTGRLRRELIRVARRGGRVQLILPGQSDVPLSRLASHSHYTRLLRAGIEVWEYQPQILHSKLLVIDHVAYAGSANLDTRSLHINYELMIRLTDPAAVAGARQIVATHAAQARPVHLAAWVRSRTVWQKFKERWAAILLGRLDTLFLRWQLSTSGRELPPGPG